MDFRIPQPLPGYDDEEYLVARNFTYLTRLVRNISRMNSVYARIKRKKDWGIDPELVQLNPSLNSWLAELPPDLSVTFPPGTAFHSPSPATTCLLRSLRCRWEVEAPYDYVLLVGKGDMQTAGGSVQHVWPRRDRVHAAGIQFPHLLRPVMRSAAPGKMHARDFRTRGG